MHAPRILSGNRLWLLGAAAAVALAAPVSAQRAEIGGPWGAAVASARPIPSAEATVLLVPALRAVATSSIPILPPQQRSRPTNVTLMIVGGAGLVVGSLIGGDTGTVVMVGSGIAGLIGLYRYLQ